MNNKGFTLIELVATFIILAIIGGLGAYYFTSTFNNASNNYYRILEGNILLAGNDYFSDHRPDTVNGILSVSIERLVREHYIEEIKDRNGNICDDGEVYKYLDENHQYQYKVCLRCGDYLNDGCA